MIYLTGRLLKTESLPARDSFPPSGLVTVLAGDDTLRLVADQESFDQLAPLERDAEITVRLGWRKLSMRDYGGKGNAYRLRITEVIR